MTTTTTTTTTTMNVNIVLMFSWFSFYGFIYSHELAEKRLHWYLFHERKYMKLIRPVGNDSDKLLVKLGMRLSQLLDVEWTDFRLTWDPDVYEGITMTNIPSDELWRPDIVLYNNYCPIDVEYFPFDMQVCFMKFSIWTYDGNQVDLQHLCDHKGILNEQTLEKVIDRGVDLKDFYPNVEWDIINVTARRKERFYPCCPEPYPDITFNITLRRRTLFYSLNLIMPCLSISLLTVLVFYLPSDSGEKITLSISILLALTVFFLLLSDINPPTSFVIPLIGKYLLFTMIVVTMSISLTVYTLGIHFRKPSTHKMKPWVKRIFTEILPRILLMKRPETERKTSFSVGNDRELSRTYEISSNVEPREENKPSTIQTLLHRHIDDKQMSKYPQNVRDALRGVKYIADHLREADRDHSVSIDTPLQCICLLVRHIQTFPLKHITKIFIFIDKLYLADYQLAVFLMEERDWKYVAMVMDRLFLYIFTTACICGTLSIFLYAPSLFDPRPPLPLHDPLSDCTY
ncbi:hypothetical protein KUTeg_024625 [Tegillarca granosa]|uniref:Uncharacterized protein n=1 Tax=Tegillarca granosa TaxID=220873 RepID=A0ABQ9E1U9_TEGGR|nr:hypothetical protein KUTeg_024625 [Tegillarca granosa]